MNFRSRKRLIHGFTLVELLSTLAVVAFLVALTTGVAGKFQAKGRGVECLSNLRQLGLAAMAYAADNNQQLPGASHNKSRSWSVVLKPYAGGTLVFRCPADEHRTRSYTYAINDFLTANPAGAPQLDYSRMAAIPSPSRTLLFAEAAATYTGSNHFHFTDYAGAALPETEFSSQVGVTRHQGSASYVFADGHAELLLWTSIKPRLADVSDPLVDPTRGSSGTADPTPQP